MGESFERLPDSERTLDDVIDAIRHSYDMGRRGCSLLIGAGCSVTAGIPGAAGFVDLVRTRFVGAYDRAARIVPSGVPGYPQCMGQLPRGQQRDLIVEQVSKAKINWAHTAIAQLIKHGYVNRILTTNFDPLILRACAMSGEYPAVYDFAISQLFRPGELPNKAIFHLHGQSTGFVLMNTEQEVRDHSARLKPLFEDAGRARPWIVVGYSGDNDPVFDHLAATDRFDYSLFWVCFKDEEPRRHVREKLLQPGKDAYLVRGYDADRFFIELAQKLECFPPDFVRRPFSFLKASMTTLTEYRLQSGDKEIDVLQDMRELIEKAIRHFEEASSTETIPRSGAAIELAATALLMAGKYEDLSHLEKSVGTEMTHAMRDVISWSHIAQGNALSKQAKTKSGEAADALFAAAGEKYAAALAIKPDKHEALNNWGVALGDQAKTKSGEAADALFAAAAEKYAAALAIKPDKHEALTNWGNTLGDQAKTKSGEAADALFAAAGEKYAAALAIKPDLHAALTNWGATLGEQAKTKSGEAADALFAAAGEKCAAALAIKPDKHEALTNWGDALGDQAKTKSGEAADALFAAAGEKYAAALAIKPDLHAALNNWGAALADQAKTKSGEAADALFAAAGEKYAAALAIKPDLHEALTNWGAALGGQAKTKSGEAADALFAAAGEKYAAALAIKPDLHEALTNWGNALGGQAKTKSGEAADALFAAAGEKYATALAIRPDLHEALTNWGNALGIQAKTKSGEAADALFAAAGEKYAAALAIKPDLHAALTNWGATLGEQAKTKSGEAADRLLVEAEQKMLRAEEITSGSGAYNLACIAALREHPKDCQEWLEKAKKTQTLPERKHLLVDSDLDGVRNQSWFQRFIEDR